MEDERLIRRMQDRLQLSHAARLVVLASIGAIVLLNTLADAFAGYFLLTDDIPRFRALAVLSMGLTTVINLVLLLLVWMLFEALSRIERESDRVQSFMDTVYRRGLR